MSFKIVHGNPQIIWCPIVDSDTAYVGQIVKYQDNEGIEPLSTASGVADTTNKSVVFGIVLGTNRYSPLFSSTYNTDYVTDATPAGNTVELVGVEGPYSKHDKTFYAQVAIIDPSCVIRGDIRDGSVSTLIPQRTVAASKGHAGQCTLDTGIGGRVYKPHSASAAYANGTIYFRSGNAMGQYRILDQASSIHLKWDKPLANNASHDDVVVGVLGLTPLGRCQMQTDSESLYVDAFANASTNNWHVIVTKLDLREAGNEHVDFRFQTCHFDRARA